jgi:hypothetical protein
LNDRHGELARPQNELNHPDGELARPKIQLNHPHGQLARPKIQVNHPHGDLAVPKSAQSTSSQVRASRQLADPPAHQVATLALFGTAVPRRKLSEFVCLRPSAPALREGPVLAKAQGADGSTWLRPSYE